MWETLKKLELCFLKVSATPPKMGSLDFMLVAIPNCVPTDYLSRMTTRIHQNVRPV